MVPVSTSGSRRKSKPTAGIRVQCSCGCGNTVSRPTERRHLKGKAPPRIAASSIAFKRAMFRHYPALSQPSNPSPLHPSSVSQLDLHEEHDQMVVDADEEFEDDSAGCKPDHNEPEYPEDKSLGNGVESSGESISIDNLMDRIALEGRQHVAVEDCESEDGGSIEGSPERADFGEGDEAADEQWVHANDEDEEENEDDGPEDNEGGRWDDRGWERFQQQLADFAEEITEDELTLLRCFAYKTEEGITNRAYEKLQFVFPGTNIPSYKVASSRVEFLAAFKPVPYDCCVNSCCCFVGPNADCNACPYCNEPRKDSNNRPRKRFNYIPLIPRLKAYYRNAAFAEKLRYRHSYKADPNKITDVMDGEHYQQLKTQHVVVDGYELSHFFFQDWRDLLLGFSTDGFAPFRKRKQTCWPLIVFNYNLGPEIRFLLQYILCIGVIPGPKKPKDFDSFAWPFIQELFQLAIGVRAFDITANELFQLRAYLALAFGDMPAMAMVMQMKGHNGFRPCRMCKISGLRIPNSRNKTHYVPHDRSRYPTVLNNDSAIKVFDVTDLPLRTHAEMLQQATEVQHATTKTRSEQLSKEYGTNGTSIFMYLSSISFPKSFPLDYLIFENVMKNLIHLWTGTYKTLPDTGSEDYELQPKVWEAIGAATAACGSTIPSAYGARPPNLADDRAAITADTMSFWLQYLGPLFLARAFSKETYYRHFIKLVRLVRVCLQFEITRDDVAALRVGFQDWVTEYERIYYQYEPSRVGACLSTVHSLLHIADGIEQIGPVWTYWAFPMERYCGKLQRVIRSRRHPFANLDNNVLARSYLSHIKIQYDLGDELSLVPTKRVGGRGQFSHPDYPSCVLLSPSRSSASITPFHREKILVALATRFDVRLNVLRKHLTLDGNSTTWACVRRLEGGDDMHASVFSPEAEDRRDACHVRYDMLVDINARKQSARSMFILKTFYGELESIFVLKLPVTPQLKLEHPSTLILAGIRACDVLPRADSLGTPFYKRKSRYEVVDITCVQCLVGRVQLRAGDQWAIIDRSSELNRAFYSPDNE